MDRIGQQALSWAPSRAVFLRRVVLAGILTFAALAMLGVGVALLTGLSELQMIAAAFSLSLAFAAEDAVNWQNAKDDRWQIDRGLLIHDGPDGRTQIPLTKVAKVRKTWTGRVLITLASGQKVLIRYLPYPRQTAAQIEAACGPRDS